VARELLTARLVVPLIMLAIVGGLAVGGLTIDRQRPAAAVNGSSTTPGATDLPSGQPSTDDSGLTAAADKSSAAKGETVTISGQLTPADSGVSLKVQRDMGDGWQDFDSATTTKGDGTYSLTVKSRRTGENLFRIVAAGGDIVSNEVPVDVSG
jgi:hypothetical protein